MNGEAIDPATTGVPAWYGTAVGSLGAVGALTGGWLWLRASVAPAAVEGQEPPPR